MYYKRVIHQVLLLCCIACLVGCGAKKSEKPKELQPCKTIVAHKSNLENKWYYVGEVEAKTSTSVGFRLPGTIMTVYVNEGDPVAKGQLLAELDPQDVKSSYDIAQATLHQAEDAMRRIEMMHKEQSVPEIKYVEVQTKLEQARSMYAAAKKRLADTKLYAPVSGVIGKRNIEVGENYGMLLSAFTILDMSEVMVKVPIPEREIPKIKKGDEASICVLALGDSVHFKAHVDEISVVGDRLTHSYEVRLRVNNRQGKLMNGMVCNVQLWPKATQGVKGFVLPVCAVKSNAANEHYVWVVKGNKTYRQTVSIGMYSKDGIIIYEGLRDGDHVVVEGQEKISDGQTVKEIQ